MTEDEITQTESGVAVLAEGFDEGDGSFVVSGVALGAGDVTHGQSGVPTFWSSDVLRRAAEKFEGAPIAKNDHSPDEQPNADNVIGEVTEARYEDGVGVVFRGEIIDGDIARKIDEGLLDVSPVMARELADEEIEVNGEQVVPAESIRDVREVGVVMRGAAPSNSITTGEAALAREALSQAFASGNESLASINGTEIDLSPPDSMINAAEAAAEAGREGLIPSDCGTGVGDRRRQQILNAADGGELSPDVVREIASYLVSHEEDVTASGTPPNWSEEEWGDCGNAQYAKWGGTGGGEPMGWAMRRVNEIDEARGDEPTYPEVMSEALAELSELSDGTKVSWGASGGPAYGIVRDTIEDGQYDDEIDGDVVVNAPAALIDTHLNTDGPEEATGATVAHKPDTLSVIEEFPASQTDSEANASATDDGADATDAPEETDEALAEVAGVIFDDTASGDLDESEIPNEGYQSHYLYPGETKTESSYAVVDGDGNLRRGNVISAHSLGCRGRCDDADEHDRRVTELARQFDDVPEFAQEEANSENETMGEDDINLSEEEHELLSEIRQYDDPEVVSADEREALRDEVATAKDAYAEVLADEWGTDSEKIAENFGIEALREEVEGLGEEGDDGVEALTQNPETGDVEETNGETGLAALSEDERAEAEDHIGALEQIGEPSNKLAKNERKRRVEALSDLTGYDAEEVEVEVL